ncbi:hypothetical protein [Bradyrhizobium diazoefficiens]|uniref:hypothetical protein n=1 Tax=Bradyrhizobium diazoefficiens TaxID=1355477 RepID=UPI0004B3DDD6|nr:hypothetical protein [Bradyrhizobium diazoefficiens]
MVKDSKKGSQKPQSMRDKLSVPRPVPMPRRKNPTQPLGSDTREDRLMMRMHEELVLLLNKRSAEAGESRSRYIEKILVGFLRADPRNPRIDSFGRLDPTAPPPLSTRNDPMKFGEKWSLWKDLNVRLGLPAPLDELVEDDTGYNMWAARAVPDQEE